MLARVKCLEYQPSREFNYLVPRGPALVNPADVRYIVPAETDPGEPAQSVITFRDGAQMLIEGTLGQFGHAG